MPHVIVKLWPGKSEEKKSRLAEAIVRDVMEVLDRLVALTATVNLRDKTLLTLALEADREESVEALDDLAFKGLNWARKVYQPDIAANTKRLYKAPGYKM